MSPTMKGPSQSKPRSKGSRHKNVPSDAELRAEVDAMFQSPITRSNLTFMQVKSEASILSPDGEQDEKQAAERAVTAEAAVPLAQQAPASAPPPLPTEVPASITPAVPAVSEEVSPEDELSSSDVLNLDDAGDEGAEIQHPEPPEAVQEPLPEPEPSADGISYAVRKIGWMQLALSNAESTVFDTIWRLWQQKNPQKPKPESVLFTIGYKRLASATSMHKISCRNGVAGLVAKSALKIVKVHDSKTSTGQTYKIFSAEKVRQIWLGHGWTHYFKRRGGGAVFCTETGVEIPLAFDKKNNARVPYKRATRDAQRQDSSAGNKEGGINYTPASAAPGVKITPAPGANFVSDPGVKIASGAGAKFIPHSEQGLSSSSENQTTTTTSVVDVQAVTRALMDYLPSTDQSIVDEVIASCESLVPDIETDELVEAIHVKGRETAPALRSAMYPAKYLKSAVVRYFDGAAFHTRRRTAADAQKQQAEMEATRVVVAAVEAELQRLNTASGPLSQIKALLKETMNPLTWDTWIRPLRYGGEKDGLLRIILPDEAFRTVEGRFGKQIEEALTELALPFNFVEYVTFDELCAARKSTSDTIQ